MFLIEIDLFTSLFVYLEEAAEAHTDVAFLPYSGFLDDVQKAMEREDQYDPPFRTVTATEGKKEWKEQKDTVATLLEIVKEGVHERSLNARIGIHTWPHMIFFAHIKRN